MKGSESFWLSLSPGDRAHLLEGVKQRFKQAKEDEFLDVEGKRYRVEFKKEEIRFPFRPTSDHWLGIDAAGRDVFARILYACRIALSFGSCW